MDILTLSLLNFFLEIRINYWLIFILFLLLILFIFKPFSFILNKIYDSYEINEIKLGLDGSSVSIRPNNKDKEIAYKLWVELTTRKLAIPFDEENDVIVEVYDSWYNFFSIARELLKEFSVSKLKKDSSKEIIKITNHILNKEIRGHLTRYQAKFRKWYNDKLENNSNFTPQDIQKLYSEYDELIKDMCEVNEKLIYYKKILEDILFKESFNN